MNSSNPVLIYCARHYVLVSVVMMVVGLNCKEIPTPLYILGWISSGLIAYMLSRWVALTDEQAKLFREAQTLSGQLIEQNKGLIATNKDLSMRLLLSEVSFQNLKSSMENMNHEGKIQ